MCQTESCLPVLSQVVLVLLHTFPAQVDGAVLAVAAAEPRSQVHAQAAGQAASLNTVSHVWGPPAIKLFCFYSITVHLLLL